MTVSPRTFAAQVRFAQHVNRQVPTYSTSTGQRAPRAGVTPAPRVFIEDDPHCFVCSRHTDHYAEHDDMVEAGTAYYGEDGSVWPTGTGPRHW